MGSSCSFLLHLKLDLVATDRSYPPMGNCCGSAATVPSEAQPDPPVVELKPFAPAPLQLNKKKGSSISSSSRPPYRPRGHSSASKHESTHHSGRSSPDPTPRSRTKSAPQPPKTFKSSSSQDPRPRARSVIQSKISSRSDFRPTAPGETIIESGSCIFGDRLKRARKVGSPFTEYELS